MNLQENISRIKEVMGLLTEEKVNKTVKIYKDGWGSDYADKYKGNITNIPVKDTIPNEPFKDLSYMETSDNVKDMIKSINDGKELPPIVVIKNPQDPSKYNVVDGNHRRYAFTKSDVTDIPAIIIPYEDVILMKNQWGDENEEHMNLTDVLDNKKILDKYFVRPNGSNDFNAPNKEETKEGELTEKCWPGYTQKGMKTMFGKKYPNCVKKKKK